VKPLFDGPWQVRVEEGDESGRYDQPVFTVWLRAESPRSYELESLREAEAVRNALNEVWTVQYCDRCDGVGWYEGGKTLQTTCEACAGTGYKGGRLFHGPLCRCGSTIDIETGVCDRSGILATHCH